MLLYSRISKGSFDVVFESGASDLPGKWGLEVGVWGCTRPQEVHAGQVLLKGNSQ